MNSVAAEMFGTPLNLGSGEVVKEAIKELFREEPEFFSSCPAGDTFRDFRTHRSHTNGTD
ncbi:hypothetical protein [Methanosarcina horonobensis]|uniref:hypothetical protein n=1 Tax=Methanosarcina horonobensis TaxID=418008 RepID=UPI000B1751B7|nr:hypothetical protein [Methanosarcina horonobensis]